MPDSSLPTPAWQRVLNWLLPPLAAAGLGLLLLRSVDWLLSLPVLPFRGPLRLISGWPEPQVTIGALTLGALAGLVLAFLIDQESLRVTITGTQIELDRIDAHVVVPRADVAVGFREKDRLVLLGRTGAELAREPCHLKPAALAAFFAAHGVPWADADPYADAYRRWIPESPELPGAVHAVFRVREKALKNGEEDDRDELRRELARLGYVVRDEKKRQYWRKAG